MGGSCGNLWKGVLGRCKFPSLLWEAKLGRSLRHRQFVSCCKFLEPSRSSSPTFGLTEMFKSPLLRVANLLSLV